MQTCSDVVIVGAGLVGLATARELLLRNPALHVTVLEKENAIAAHQSGHNSGIIHSGIYYAPGSLKAKLCIQGRQRLEHYCDEKGIARRTIGKLIVAVDQAELPRLEELWQRGQANGIAGLEMLNAREILEREPHCHGLRAIHVPVTGIVDYKCVAEAYTGDVLAAGGKILTDSRVEHIEQRTNSVVLRTQNAEIETARLITCAGLFSDRLAQMSGGSPEPKIVPFRGDYLVLKPEARNLVRGNIYPVPDPAFPFLGAHFTPRMNGEVWLGPNAVLAFAREGYSIATIDPRDLFETMTYPGFIKLTTRHVSVGFGELYRDMVRGAFVKRLRRYIPQLQVSDTLPGPSGVRAQAMRSDGTLVDDFVFDVTEKVLHVRNAPSPAATSSLAIASHIADEAEKNLNLPALARK